MNQRHESPNDLREAQQAAAVHFGTHNSVNVYGDVFSGNKIVIENMRVVIGERGASRLSMEDVRDVQRAIQQQVTQHMELPEVWIDWGATAAQPAQPAHTIQVQRVSVDQASLIAHKHQLLVADTVVLPVWPDEDAAISVFGGQGLYTVRLRLDAAGNLLAQSWLGSGFEVQPSSPAAKTWPVSKAHHKWKFERCGPDEMTTAIQNINIAFSSQAVAAVWRIWHQRTEFREEKFLVVLGKA